MGRFLSNTAFRSRPAGAPVRTPVPRVAATPAKPPAVSVDPEAAEKQNPFRKLVFYAGLALLFARVSVISEMIVIVFGVNTYLLYVVGPPAILGSLLAGGMRRSLRNTPIILWMGFVVWMTVATPFSMWPGNSTARVLDYVRYNLPLLFVVGGLALSFSEIRLIFYTIAGAGVVNLLSARILANETSGRLEFGATRSTIGNSNDLASHLILILPFFLYIVLDGKRSTVIRLASVGAIFYGIWVILGTASRGGLIALCVSLGVLFAQASMARKVTLLAGAAAIAALIVPLLPSMTKARLDALFGGEHVEAEESQASRHYLLLKSIDFTLHHPVFGVGPDQFPNAEGMESLSKGQHGNWHASHCAFTQVSSECGIPALVFFTGALAAVVIRVWRQLKMSKKLGNVQVTNVCLCYLVSMLGYLASIVFLSNAYGFYLPAMIGLGVTISFVVQQELQRTPVPAALRTSAA